MRDLAVFGVDPMQNFLCFQSVENRLKRVVQRQHMADTAAAGEWQHNFMLQCALRQQIEQGLQRARKRRFIDRCRHNQPISRSQIITQGQQRGCIKTRINQIVRLKVVNIPGNDFNATSFQLVLTQRQ